MLTFMQHTQKRHPSTHLTHADDATNFWDFASQNPESAHQFLILFGDRGIPDGYRKMHGYHGHTHKLQNKDGGKFFSTTTSITYTDFKKIGFIVNCT